MILHGPSGTGVHGQLLQFPRYRDHQLPLHRREPREDARAIAGHESSQTTRLYDRTGERITLDEIERIRF
ncbi:MAG: hypothetical protein OXC95_07710 [Dehalococcoidia bacterium]|nr:hypothetical protein [Dehalococcoidia bacterium]